MTMSIAGAFTAAATLVGTVAGVAHSYDLNAVPESVDRVQMPCAVVYLEAGQEQGFSTLAFQGNNAKIGFSIKQLILYAPTQVARYQDVAPGMVAMLDAYLQVLRAYPFLVDITANPPPIGQPAKVKPAIGPVTYGGVEYHVIELLYSLEIYL